MPAPGEGNLSENAAPVLAGFVPAKTGVTRTESRFKVPICFGALPL
jgi:hypothetical protein